MLDINRHILATFTEDAMPTLDVAVLGALEMLAKTEVPVLEMGTMGTPLVIGSGNALATGRFLFARTRAIFASESVYEERLAQHREYITSAVVISASGGKHAVGIIETLASQGIETWLFTNNPTAPARRCVADDHVLLFPKNREPYTYNTSTYMSMLAALSGERAEDIFRFIEREVNNVLPDFSDYDSFYFIVPPQFATIREMILAKFDELFGSKVSARVFSLEETKHAKTVVPSLAECFIALGEENDLFGHEEHRVFVPLPADAGPVAFMAVSYFVIGQIQKDHPPYYMENIHAYTERASEIFRQDISPIVE
jgi:hypothetical protein